MDFVLNRINKEIENQEFLNSDSLDLKENYRVRCEYLFILMLAYLWDKKINSSSDKQEILNKILKPTLGTILWIIEKLDDKNETISKDAVKILKNYNSFREEHIISPSI